ncbi:MAG: hypothetical protein Q9167_002714 [Letrouitia subvulpina]
MDNLPLEIQAVHDFEDWKDWRHQRYAAGQDLVDEEEAVTRLLREIARRCPLFKAVELDYDGDPNRDDRADDMNDTFNGSEIFETADHRTRRLLAVPTYMEGIFGVREQFVAMLTRSRALTLSGRILPWKVFEPAEETVRKTCSSLKTLENLSLEMEFPFRDYSRANLSQLANFIGYASNLRSLELSFDILPFRCIERTIRLDAVLSKRIYWPSLERLRLQAVSTSDKYFRDFLATHRHTLRSLELKHIKLREDFDRTLDIEAGNSSGEGDVEHGSWIDMIKFLQADFNLKHVQLGGILSNCWDENWHVFTPEELHPYKTSFNKPPIKERIEAWIIHGGSTPLADFETTNKGDWKRLARDESWQFIPEMLDSS